MEDQSVYLFVDHFINSHHLFPWQYVDIVRRKLILVIVGAQRIKGSVLILLQASVLCSRLSSVYKTVEIVTPRKNWACSTGRGK